MKEHISNLAYGLLVFFTCITLSCGHKKEPFSSNVIPVASAVGSYHLLNLSQYALDIKYIPLETEESSLIAGIQQIVYEDEKIVISDDYSNGYLFDNNGAFQCRVGSIGRGPGEYRYISDILIYDHLIFLNDSRQMIIFNANGRLVESILLRSPELPAEYLIRNVLPLKKDTYVMDVVTMRNQHYPKAILLESHNSTLRPIKEYPSYVQLNKNISSGGYSSNEVAKMYRFRDEIRTYKYINYDTLFTIGQDTEMKAAFIFELGEFKPTLEYFNGRDYSRGMHIICPDIILESNNHLFITFRFGDHAPEPFTYMFAPPGSVPWERINKNVCGVFDKSTGELVLMSQPVKRKLGFKNDVDNGPVIWPHYISSNDELVTFISAEEFLDHLGKMEKPTPQMVEISKRIDIDDNPIVIIAKLKK